MGEKRRTVMVRVVLDRDKDVVGRESLVRLCIGC
jgi:hypothetical protein